MYRKNKSVIPFIKKKSYADLVYLTWVDDPLTTMTIQWHTIETRVGTEPNTNVLYREEGTEEWQMQETQISHDMPFPEPVNEKARKVHWTTLRGLMPDTAYEFAFDGESRKQIRKFKTMPQSLDRPIKIVFASDSHYGIADITDMSWVNFPMITDEMRNTDPDMVLGGGDYTYDDGRTTQGVTAIWVKFLKEMEKRLINSNGYMIPFITAFGNHDGGYHFDDYINNVPHDPENTDVNFMKLFAFPTTQNHAYGGLSFGDYLQLLCLENGYAQPIEECTEWLVDNIDDTKKHVLPFYHIPLYGYRGNRIDNHTKAIEQWEPVFNANRVKIALNGHLHSYYYTKPLLNGEVVGNNEGVVYCGNGAWSLNRPSWDFIEPIPEWIERQAHGDYDSENVNHFYLLTLFNNKIKVDSINKNGVTFDSFERLV
jgi:hypothetical protein